MNLATKWRIRQSVIRTLSAGLSVTMFVTLYLWIKFLKFLDYGVDMYPGIKLAKATASTIFHVFRDVTLEPVLFRWLPIAVLIDLLIISPIKRRLIK